MRSSWCPTAMRVVVRRETTRPVQPTQMVGTGSENKITKMVHHMIFGTNLSGNRILEELARMLALGVIESPILSSEIAGPMESYVYF